MLSGIVFVNRNGLRWRDAPSAYDSHKTLYNRWKRWGERGVFGEARLACDVFFGDAVNVGVEAAEPVEWIDQGLVLEGDRPIPKADNADLAYAADARAGGLDIDD